MSIVLPFALNEPRGVQTNDHVQSGEVRRAIEGKDQGGGAKPASIPIAVRVIHTPKHPV